MFLSLTEIKNSKQRIRSNYLGTLKDKKRTRQFKEGTQNMKKNQNGGGNFSDVFSFFFFFFGGVCVFHFMVLGFFFFLFCSAFTGERANH